MRSRTASVRACPERELPLNSEMALSMRGRYSSLVAAWRMRDGFVVASWGMNSFMASKSPVSATTVVNFLSRSS